MTQTQDFSTRSRLPGTDSSRFDFLLRLSDAIENLPATFFAQLWLALAMIATREAFVRALIALAMKKHPLCALWLEYFLGVLCVFGSWWLNGFWMFFAINHT